MEVESDIKSKAEVLVDKRILMLVVGEQRKWSSMAIEEEAVGKT